MKVDRLIGILTILLRQEKITAPQLAQRFEVSRRTITRDIDTLCRAGIPLLTTQGRGGGISIMGGYKLDKTLLTQEELQTVFASLQGLGSVSKSAALSGLIEKLSNQRPPSPTDDTLIINLASHYQDSLTQKIEGLRQAIRKRTLVEFQYYYEKGEDFRTIEPYRIVFQWSSWYLFGFCRKRNAFRLFKLNRLWDLRELDKNFSPREIPRDELNFSDFLSQNTIHLKALFALSQKYRLIDEYGIGCYTQMPQGGLLVEQDFSSYTNLREWIFSFGDTVEILEPAQLREDRLRQAQSILSKENTPADKK